MISISIIIPCFNAEQYMRECMESILAQTLHEIEIICIDDGSTDRTFEILEEYQKNADNVKILQQKKQGSGIARNRGIMMAQGEYIAFIDADDFYPSTSTLEKVYNAAIEKEALICGGSVCNYCDGAFAYNGMNKGLVFSEDRWISKRDFPTANGFWRFIYKSKFIRDNQLFFPKYLRGQDPPFFLEAIAHAGQVYCMKEVTYVYRKGHKQLYFSQEKAIDYAKAVRDCLMISKREGMMAIYSQRLNFLHGTASACMYLYAETCAEMQSVIHQINEVLDSSTDGEASVPLLKEGEELVDYLRDVREEKKRLLDELKIEKKILVFGAGIIGRRVRAFLEKNDIVMEAFVVSNVTQNNAFVDGLQVRCIDDYIDVRNDFLVIIATSWALQDEIKEILWKKGFERVYPLSPEKFYLFEGQVVC